MSERGGRRSEATGLQTEFPFTLPKGYVDHEGTLHREGVMRLAKAIDEIAPLRDPRIKANPSYLTIVLLARVITRLGTLSDVNSGTIEGLFSADLVYLQDLYTQINQPEAPKLTVTCPSCNNSFDVDVSTTGES
jgi:hypothetical protein